MSKQSKSKDKGCTEFPFAHNAEAIKNNENKKLSPTLSSQSESQSNTATAALHSLKDKLSNVPHNEKSSLVYVQRVTDLVNDEHLLRFLHVENFDVDVSISL